MAGLDFCLCWVRFSSPCRMENLFYLPNNDMCHPPPPAPALCSILPHRFSSTALMLKVGWKALNNLWLMKG